MEVMMTVMMMITLMTLMMVMRVTRGDYLGEGCFLKRLECCLRDLLTHHYDDANILCKCFYLTIISIFVCWQLFDRKFVDAVLNEWHKTVMDLPAGFRQAYEMVQCISY